MQFIDSLIIKKNASSGRLRSVSLAAVLIKIHRQGSNFYSAGRQAMSLLPSLSLYGNLIECYNSPLLFTINLR